jgi:hypothetical protein
MKRRVIYLSLLLVVCFYDYPQSDSKIVRYVCYAAVGTGIVAIIVWHLHARQKKLIQQQHYHVMTSTPSTTHTSDGDYEQEILDYLQYPRSEIQGYEEDFDELNPKQKRLLFNAIQKQKAHKNFLKEISTIAGLEFHNKALQTEYWTLIDNCSQFYTYKQSPQYLLEQFRRENNKISPSENLD